MKILVLSDSHGDPYKVYDIVQKNSDCQVIIHLGDGEDDFEVSKDRIPNFYSKRLIQVRGNCDWGSNLAVTSFDKIGGFLFYNTHGYQQNVKMGYYKLLLSAKENEREVALFGHTHEPFYEYIDGVHLFNPGAARDGHYGIITIDEKAHEIKFDLK